MAGRHTLVAASVSRPRLLATIVTAFAVVGVVLAVVGLYGVLSYVVAARRREFGVRLALGATARDLIRMVVGQGAVVVAVGVAAGAAGALMLARAVESVLFGVTTRELSVYAAAALTLTAAAAIAIWLPARRATRVDWVDVLRCELV